MIENQDGWRLAKKPGLLQRLKARRAMRAYEKARVVYDRLKRQMDTLEAEREAMMRAAAARIVAGSPEDDRFSTEFGRFNQLFNDLAEPWLKAEADMHKAYAAAMKLLNDMGFEEIPHGERPLPRACCHGAGER